MTFKKIVMHAHAQLITNYKYLAATEQVNNHHIKFYFESVVTKVFIVTFKQNGK